MGQPRDENYRPCFVVQDTETNTIQYHRIDYDAQVTRDKIHAIPDLDNMLGDRLMTGR